jgi:hypothetical protein
MPAEGETTRAACTCRWSPDARPTSTTTSDGLRRDIAADCRGLPQMTGNAATAARELADRLDIRLLSNAGPRGPSAARNTAIRASGAPVS